jgi:uncharacterized circularly permuted ATP-grasp superfamily protein/uncharacterized alpha-E superfamily protein
VADVLAHLAQPAAAGHFDELRAFTPSAAEKPASLAPHWSSFFNALGNAGLGELDRKGRELDRQVRDNGITYNVYADESSDQRPWSLGLLPVVLSQEDWAQIEAGILQRADLCERIMADIYGPQRLLKEAFIPPALVHGHPGYLRPMHGVVSTLGSPFFQIVAFDLARSPSGDWAVVSQRTQAPSGLGYMLENRQLISRHFASTFSALNVSPLADAYRALVYGLKASVAASGDAHVALLTPGPYNETYFEHAYLARALGLTLVEGSDLTVRDERLFLRTLKGLEPVEVLLKRLDDPFLDPLELRSDSTLGVPGLIQAIRAGNVRVANMPGSGFLESPALLGFLPAMCEALLGEPLRLPAMDTWWCGERAACVDVMEKLSGMVIKPSYPTSALHSRFDTTLGYRLNEEAQAAVRRRIAADPDGFTLQSYVPLSQIPVWQPSETAGTLSIVSRSFMLRVFAIRGADHAWRVIPGGLARVAGAFEPDIASMQRGGASADVWVCGQANAADREPISLHGHPDGSGAPQPAVNFKHSVTSRSGENLFWFGRYTERSENTVRLARLCLEAINGERTVSRVFWDWMQSLMSDNGMIPGSDSVKGTAAAESAHRMGLHEPSRQRVFERTVISYLDSSESVTSVGFNLRSMQRSASVVRERLSAEQWTIANRCVDEFSRDMALAAGPNDYSSVQALQALSNASSALAAISGAQLDRMTHDEGWQLLSLGRHIERLGFLSEALVFALNFGAMRHLPEDDAGFTGLLALFDSTITFRYQYQQRRDLQALLQLLVLDHTNPRALAWVVSSLRHRWQTMVDATAMEMGELPELTEATQLLDARRILALAEAKDHAALAQLFMAMRNAAWQMSDRVSALYFVHSHLAETSIGA